MEQSLTLHVGVFVNHLLIMQYVLGILCQFAPHALMFKLM